MAVSPLMMLLIPYIILTGIGIVSLIAAMRILPPESRRLAILAFAIIDGLLTLAFVLALVFWALPQQA